MEWEAVGWVKGSERGLGNSSTRTKHKESIIMKSLVPMLIFKVKLKWIFKKCSGKSAYILRCVRILHCNACSIWKSDLCWVWPRNLMVLCAISNSVRIKKLLRTVTVGHEGRGNLWHQLWWISSNRVANNILVCQTPTKTWGTQKTQCMGHKSSPTGFYLGGDSLQCHLWEGSRV